MPKKRLNVNWDREVRTEDFRPAPFSNSPAIKSVKWLKPKLVVEIVALEVSKRRHLRAPVFLRRRTDKVPEECTIDQLDQVPKGSL